MATNGNYLRKEYKELDEIIAKWYDSLCREGGLCVAISRKAPRLIEWCIEKYGMPEDTNLNIVSELSIPFIDFKRVKSCMLIDEAIYHGTTFTKIYDMINESSDNIEIKALPLFVSESAIANNPLLNGILDSSVFKINSSYVNFFIDTIVKRFHEGIKPYDMEFPILYLDFDHTVTKEEVELALKKLNILESNKYGYDIPKCYYSTTTYSRERNETFTSFTYLFEYSFGGYLPQSKKPDFAKLRINFKGNRVSITVMSPYVIPAANLQTPDSIFTGELEMIWQTIWRSAHMSQTDNAEINYQREKSLVVMANYLLSYNNLLCLLDNILQSFNVSKMSLSSMDLKYLVGDELVKKLFPMLNSISEPTDFSFNWLSDNIDRMYIPYSFRRDYLHSMGSANLKAKSLEEKISNQFSAMHWDVEVNSRENTSGDYYGRLRFGESYSSLMERYRIENLDSEKLRSQIHQNIDSRVDAGSVVPNYVMLNDVSPYWLRLFRSGENEDVLKDQFNRVILFIYDEYNRISESDNLPFYLLQMICSLLIYRDQNKISRVFGYEVEYERKDLVQCAFLKTNELRCDIIDKVATSGLFNSVDGASFVIRNTLLNCQYQTGNPLSQSLEDEVRAAIIFANDYCSKQVEGNRLKVSYLENLLTYDFESFSHEFAKWLDGVEAELDVVSEDGVNKQVSEYLELLTRIPSADISVSKCADSDWTKVFNQLITEFQKHTTENAKFENQLNRAVYILNMWSKKVLSFSNNIVANPKLRDAYLSVFSEEERSIFNEMNNISTDKLKVYFLDMLRK